ncbi:MAG: radical SAM protein [Eubacteriales bacterium]|nr:radical SAM protein [Eubacteriales bacterium]MDD4422521.1 radical SAM protein [Eubacteriales bacterium]HBR32882.1 hypothetical protein [Clostridiales bacterium]
MKNHSNIPFFIPHSGCKNNCVFCSQVKITGKERKEPELSEELSMLKSTIEEAIKTIPLNTEKQLAFFGGSFTGIDKDRMIALLETGYEYVKTGKISGIRISTRPDYIDDGILEVLKHYGVTDIELGIQSMNDRVLKACARGHSAADSYRSGRLVVKHGFNLTGQIMIGLPLSEPDDEIETTDAVIDMKASGARIYPLVVFADTPLYDMTLSGKYKPLTDMEAVERSAICYERFIKAGVKVLKIGLHSSESLAAAEYGANHPSIGELVKARIYFNRISEQLKNIDCRDKKVDIYVKEGEQSKLTGHGKKLLNELTERFGIKQINVKTTDTEEFSPIIKCEE